VNQILLLKFWSSLKMESLLNLKRNLKDLSEYENVLMMIEDVDAKDVS